MQKLIDLRLGEVRSIRDITYKLFDLQNSCINMTPEDWEYNITGYEPLVKTLEDTYGVPVIITNGANQALHAAVYAFKRAGFNKIGCRIPYWNRIPAIIANLHCKPVPFAGSIVSKEKLDIDSYLTVLPNNPDGYLPTSSVIKSDFAWLKENNIPVIHDAAYYTRTYLPIDHSIENLGDIQIFSASKAYGLSSLRIGYAVINNPKFYSFFKEYLEFYTVGTSLLSQKIFLDILEKQNKLPIIKSSFEKDSREVVLKAKAAFQKINKDLIEFPDSCSRNYGIFAWLKPKTKDIFKQANIEVLDGDCFGAPGFVRINLGAGLDLIEESVKRLNDIKI